MCHRIKCITENKNKQTCTLKCQGLKKILLFIQPIFIKHLLHFPDTVLGPENTNKGSPCPGWVYTVVKAERVSKEGSQWSWRWWSTFRCTTRGSCLWLKWETKDGITFPLPHWRVSPLFLSGLRRRKEKNILRGITIPRREETSPDGPQTALQFTSRS